MTHSVRLASAHPTGGRECFPECSHVCSSCSGNIGGYSVGRCGDDGWQSTRKGDTPIKAKQLKRDLSLIVIHRHHPVKVHHAWQQ